MRRAALCLLALAACGAAKPAPQPSKPAPQPIASAPPHAWLFGTWTGGLFPVLDGMAEQDCRTQPTVRFGQDLVAHATLLDTAMAPQTIETVRATATGAEFRFTPGDPALGFGCDAPNVLHVMRDGGNAISFPNCPAFPYKLQRCTAR